VTAKIITGPFSPRAPQADAPFDEEVTAPPPAPPEEVEDRRGGGSGGGRGKRAKPGDFGPVVPLGTTTSRGTTALVFLDAAGKRSMLSAAQIRNASWLSLLFGGDDGRETLMRLWPKRTPVTDAEGKPVLDDKGEPKMAVTGFNPVAAGDALISACVRAGDAGAAELRRDGLWRHSDGSLLHHCGNLVRYAGADHAPGLRDGIAIYVSAERREPPAPAEATIAECEALEEAFRLWNFADPASAELLMGLVACGIYGAVLSWRPHVFIQALEGSGKSSLNRLVALACGAGEPSTDISEPGIRRMYNSRSGIIPLDEAESNAHDVGRVVGLMRGASDGEGSKTVRAAQDGSGHEVFRVAGCFLLTAITQPKMTAADLSRITRIDLRPIEVDRTEEVRAAQAMARELHPKLLARLLARWPQYEASLAAAREAVLATDSTGRSADQLGALFAGWWVLHSDAPLTPDQARDVMPRFAGFVSTRAEAAEHNTARRALNHMLASRVPVGLRSGDYMTLQQALSEADGAHWAAVGAKQRGDAGVYALEQQAKSWRKKLGGLGLRLIYGPEKDAWPGKGPPTPGVWVRNGAPPIEACFAGTEWSGGAWEGLLRQLPDAQVSKTSMKFTGGGQDRAVLVIMEHLGLEDAGDDG
jgi:hypothetical protein